MHISTRNFLDPAFLHPLLSTLDTLKITFTKTKRAPVAILDLTFPNLRSLLYSGRNVNESVLSGFLSRHAHHLRNVSLDCDMVPGLRCLTDLRALHLGSDQRLPVVYVQLVVWSEHLLKVVHLRISEVCFAVLVQKALPHYKTTKPEWPQNLRCLELEYGHASRLAGFRRENILPPLLCGLKELAFIVHDKTSGGETLQNLIVREMYFTSHYFIFNV